jgi:hypothetical protein
MGCCAKRRSRKAPGKAPRLPRQAALPRSGPGEACITYLRKAAAPRPFRGPVTRNLYYFGGWRRRGAVPDEDLGTGNPEKPGFLEMRDGAGLIFAIVD